MSGDTDKIMGKADNAKAIAEDAIKQLESAEQPSTEDEI